jgi:hypothetical protein
LASIRYTIKPFLIGVACPARRHLPLLLLASGIVLIVQARALFDATRTPWERSPERGAEWSTWRADPSAGEPVRIQGTILKAVEGYGQFWVSIKFGRNNVLILSTYLVQIVEPFSLNNLGLDISAFQIMAIKSRVHFRRGFHDNGFAKTILLVEPTEPFLGTVRLDKLPYENVDLKRYYPYGNPAFPG